MREKMDGILFICQTTHRLKKIGTEKSLLFVNIELKNGEKINHENHFSKKDQQQHFAFIVMTSWRF